MSEGGGRRDTAPDSELEEAAAASGAAKSATAGAARPSGGGAGGAIDRWFGISRAGSTVRTELLAGFTTFMTMAYILFVNAAVLGSVDDHNGRRLGFAQVLTSTALAGGVSSIAMGLVANYPFALAAGMGLNAVVAFQLVASAGLSWAQAMGVVVLEGLIIAVLVLTGFREAVMNAIPLALKQAIGVGIGLFISFIGFVISGFVGKPDAPELRVELGEGGVLRGAPVGIFVFGLLLTIYLVARKVRGALVIGILSSTALAVLVNETLLGGAAWKHIAPGMARLPTKVIALPTTDNFELVGHLSFGFFAQIGVLAASLAVFTLMLGDFFDTMGSVIGLGERAGFLDRQGRLPRTRQVLLVDSLAASLGGACGSSSNTTYIESASGIAEGGRTGLTAITVGVLFLASVVLWPLADVLPPQATGPALVIVGFMMVGLVREIPWDDLEVSIPAFLTMVVMPFTYSITNGIGAGFVSYAAIKALRNKSREVHPVLAISALAFVVYFGIHYVRLALGVR
jgi:AGZA family xanthine/uracil permease-like MFS transporter